MKWKRSPSVLIVPGGLRIHTVPKVASSAIIDAAGTDQKRYPEEPGNGFRFMAVRHPLERLVSAWAFFIKDTRANEMVSIGYELGWPFETFLSFALEMHDANQHTRAQWLFAGPWPLDRVVRYENLPGAWEELRATYPVLTDLKQTNVSEHGNWRDYYVGTKRSQAEQTFAADMDLYERAA